VVTEKSDDKRVGGHLQALGISLVSEWVVLAFVCSHGASLGAAALIARFIGYNRTEIAAALRTLDARGLIKRSRVSRGIRFYQLSDSIESSRLLCLFEVNRSPALGFHQA
jgi:DNA-binding MarR family transcriptional regulator